MKPKNWFRPFETIAKTEQYIIFAVWIVLLIAYWVITTSGTKHLFPTPGQVWDGFLSLYNEGLVVHIGSSLALCLQATVFSIVVSLILVYSSPLPALQPLANTLS